MEARALKVLQSYVPTKFTHESATKLFQSIDYNNNS